MIIRYFEVENEDDIYGKGKVCETKNTKIVPRKGEKVYIGDDYYWINDVCYIIDYKNTDSNNIKLVAIDVFVIKTELKN